MISQSGKGGPNIMEILLIKWARVFKITFGYLGTSKSKWGPGV